MVSGYDLSQLYMKKVGLTYPPEVSRQVSCLTCRQRERERGGKRTGILSHILGQNVTSNNVKVSYAQKYCGFTYMYLLS